MSIEHRAVEQFAAHPRRAATAGGGSERRIRQRPDSAKTAEPFVGVQPRVMPRLLRVVR